MGKACGWPGGVDRLKGEGDVTVSHPAFFYILMAFIQYTDQEPTAEPKLILYFSSTACEHDTDETRQRFSESRPRRPNQFLYAADKYPNPMTAPACKGAHCTAKICPHQQTI